MKLRLLALLALFIPAFGLRPLVAADAPPVIDLWPEGVPDLKPDATPEKEVNGTFSNIHHPSMIVYAPPAGKARTDTAVVFCAGGGYIHVAVGTPNGGQVTQWLNSIGITVFVLKYRSVEYGHPAPLRDVLRAVRIVRSRAAEFGVRPDHIGVMGGSAGGHLTASAGTLYDAPEGRTGAEIDKVSARPDFLVLIFPVLTMEEPYVHKASRTALLGPNPSEELKKHLSMELQVTKNTPPTFLVHSTADTTVPVENSLMFFQAMRNAKAPIEMHLYPNGPHGSGMATSLGPISEWPKHCEDWMRFNGWLPKITDG
ncbi:MAG TPA: alpha/beta hydrolase [Opitutaceae bacterium]|nr:alpha/beta hydrolase [Opitutaceae bacterium]